MQTTCQEVAIRAALQRTSPDLDKKGFDIELLWALEDVSFRHDGTIFWRAFKLGREFFVCLCEAQNWRCCYCGVRTNELDTSPATIEHVIPKSKGGLDHPENMVMACKVCNVARS
jgi:hypothetical protein